ncbi:EAL domain-containing protein [Enterobacter cloacae]|uniref:EAL domain-containing protein n=1 Tax=Enterobacter cloacae complex TaxID=354276 RepID=UPI0020758FBF|nr:EAL domain-containing protein [Enterobacter asburiae]MCM7836248.1 EAL domain-containing protein [Enterobacter asburiae]
MENLTLTDSDVFTFMGGKITPYIQPIINSSNNQLTGAEVLMRIKREDGSVIPPVEFIDQIEQEGKLVSATRVIMHEIVDFFQAKSDLFPEGFYFSFNISAAHFHDDGLVEDCQRFINAFKGRVGLVIELLECSVLQFDKKTVKIIKLLAKEGVRFALDDFGSGLSRVIYFHYAPISIVKLDKTLMKNSKSRMEFADVLKALYAFSRQLNMTIIAEGIETETQKRKMKEIGVNYHQGFLYSRPIPEDDFLNRFLH